MVPVGGGLVDGPCQLAMTIASPCEHMTHSTQASWHLPTAAHLPHNEPTTHQGTFTIIHVHTNNTWIKKIKLIYILENRTDRWDLLHHAWVGYSLINWVSRVLPAWLESQESHQRNWETRESHLRDWKSLQRPDEAGCAHRLCVDDVHQPKLSVAVQTPTIHKALCKQRHREHSHR